MLGEGMTAAIMETSSRMLSKRERERVGAVVLLARGILMQQLTEGAQLRGDAMLRSGVDGRAPADEVIEHVLQVAQRSYEERKLFHVAAALARIAVAETIDERSAHWIITTLDRLSWPKLVALAMVGLNAEEPLPDREVGKGFNEWTPWSAHQAFYELQHTDELIGREARKDARGRPRFTSFFNDFRLTAGGSLVYQVAELDAVTAEERTALRVAIETEDPEVGTAQSGASDSPDQ
jgi:hypothetical protein